MVITLSFSLSLFLSPSFFCLFLPQKERKREEKILHQNFFTREKSTSLDCPFSLLIGIKRKRESERKLQQNFHNRERERERDEERERREKWKIEESDHKRGVKRSR